MKYSKQDRRLLEAKFKYGNVLLGLAMLQEANDSGNGEATESSNGDGGEASTGDKIRKFTASVAPVLLPMIDQLSGLEDGELEMFSELGEDA